MVLSILRWWLAIELVALAALPLTTFLFQHLPLRGYPFGKALGLLLLGYLSWLLAMLELIPFGGPAVLAALLLIGLGSWWVLRGMERGDLLAGLRQHWRAMLAYELLFAVALYAGLWLRWNGAVGPAIFGTEKPMELAFLSGILRSDSFPPQDPWLAGYPINYYYLGYVIVAALAVLGGAGAGEAFNLGVATIFALSALMVAGVVTTLAQLARRERGETGGRGAAVGIAAAALLGVTLVLVAGNQMGFLQKLIGSSQVVALDGGQMVEALAQRLQGTETITLSRPTPKTDFGEIATITPGEDKPFDWWWPSRAVWDDIQTAPGEALRRYAITEFPFFSFYLGDMHPHVLALPFGLLALALALSVALRPAAPLFLLHGRGRLQLALTGVILGSLYAINSWDAPVYALLYAGALALLYRRLAAGAGARFALDQYLRTLGSVAVTALLLLAPFLMTFRSLAGNRPVPEPWSRIPLIRTIGRIIAPAPDHTGLHALIIIFGLFLVVLVAYALSGPRRQTEEHKTEGEQQPPALRESRSGWLWTALALLIGLLIGFPAFALLPMAATLSLQAWQAVDRPARAFVLWAAAAAALVVFGSDIVYIRDHFESRMNTIFKFYYQAWVIWGTLAAFAAWALLRQPLLKRLSTLAWMLPALLLLAGALVYPFGALRWAQPWRQGERVLDGLAYLQRDAPDEAAAIAWLREHARSGDIVLTAAGKSYDFEGTGRVAAATGLQTLLGWYASHENLWRSGSPEILAEIAAREQDIRTIYTTTDISQAQRLIEQYGIDYVYVGPLERRDYPGPGLEKFGQFLELVFEQGQVRIYRVQDGTNRLGLF